MAFRIALAAHLACALGATAVFWIPVAASKGGPLHLRAGRLYVRLIYLTALTGAPLAASLFLRAPEPGARRTAAFLAYLITILVMPVYHGVRVARAARTGAPVRSALHTAVCLTATGAGLALLAAAIAWREWPYALLSPIGPVLGIRALRYSSRLNFPGWREEHIIAMVMSGIAVHTALLVFGLGRTLHIALTGAAAYIPWVLPAVVGLPLLKPQGRLIAGRFARLAPTVKTSARYICTGSSTRSPSANAGVGLVGIAIRLTCSSASS